MSRDSSSAEREREGGNPQKAVKTRCCAGPSSLCRSPSPPRRVCSSAAARSAWCPLSPSCLSPASLRSRSPLRSSVYSYYPHFYSSVRRPSNSCGCGAVGGYPTGLRGKRRALVSSLVSCVLLLSAFAAQAPQATAVARSRAGTSFCRVAPPYPPELSASCSPQTTCHGLSQTRPRAALACCSPRGSTWSSESLRPSCRSSSPRQSTVFSSPCSPPSPSRFASPSPLSLHSVVGFLAAPVNSSSFCLSAAPSTPSYSTSSRLSLLVSAPLQSSPSSVLPAFSSVSPSVFSLRDRGSSSAASSCVSSLPSSSAGTYTAGSIRVLEGLEPVRMRPGMYIGSTDSEGLHHLVWEALDNAVDEIENGGCRNIVVILHPDRRRVTVADDGRGIPCDMHPQTGVSALETVFTKLHAGGKFTPSAAPATSSGAEEKSSYAIAGGLHGVGSSVINALSSRLHVSVLRNGGLHEMSFSRGRVLAPLRVRPSSPATGFGEAASRWKEPAGPSQVSESSAPESDGALELRRRRDIQDFATSAFASWPPSAGASGAERNPFELLFGPTPAASGTCVSFEVDGEIFGDELRLDGRKIETRLRDLAYLHPAASFQFVELPAAADAPHRRPDGAAGEEGTASERSDGGELQTETGECEALRALLFKEPGGLDAYIQHLSANLTSLFSEAPVISINGSHPSSDMSLSVRLFFSSPSALSSSPAGSEGAAAPEAAPAPRSSASVSPLSSETLASSSSDFFLSFVNSIPTPEGGAHVEGVRAGLTRAIQRLLRLSSAAAEAFPSGRGRGTATAIGRTSFLRGDARRGARRGAQGEADAEKALTVQGEFLREGLVGVVSLKMREAEFEGQTKKKLGNKKVKGIVEEFVCEALVRYFETHSQNFQRVLQKAATARAAAAAARAAREFARAKQQATSSHSTLLPGKLADCSPTNAAERRSKEIFIVEGESAAGSAKQARDRRTQAILPLRGKILNVEKLGNFRRIFENEELKALIAALGIGVTKTGEVRADLEGLRYSRIIILTDADVDGAHIRSLLLTFFFRLQPELFRRGLVFVACPPLFKISHPPTPRRLLEEATETLRRFRAAPGGEGRGRGDPEEAREGKGASLATESYVWSEDEVEKIFQVLRDFRASKKARLRKKNAEDRSLQGAGAGEETPSEVKDGIGEEVEEEGDAAGESGDRGGETRLTLPGVSLQRFKGLGEMRPEQLRRTTMSPQTRMLKRISIEDAQEAEKIVVSLMGDDIEARKRIIADASGEVFLDDLDV
ncbi:ATPase/histidine kinase/DNA gyrase B/HSP90 domain-containing protein [Besnoitia besnoiti]|uniref:DNA topoisomerase 2 n=1 Tax=Besnoitia besnoiti TaxID=94643 RepID=A0A2A9MJ83_BESBE|nr:ATPase/histidine kinase/DNA gyrase B/HSP90 domain-containing protein [Besnoitia besnoiti]PFH35460.1 ATPase/histidine kinase/DNA gyrase B/HSP90 domain-containing protein [Besnoitia besnoiti]